MANGPSASGMASSCPPGIISASSCNGLPPENVSQWAGPDAALVGKYLPSATLMGAPVGAEAAEGVQLLAFSYFPSPLPLEAIGVGVACTMGEARAPAEGDPETAGPEVGKVVEEGDDVAARPPGGGPPIAACGKILGASPAAKSAGSACVPGSGGALATAR